MRPALLVAITALPAFGVLVTDTPLLVDESGDTIEGDLAIEGVLRVTQTLEAGEIAVSSIIARQSTTVALEATRANVSAIVTGSIVAESATVESLTLSGVVQLPAEHWKENERIPATVSTARIFAESTPGPIRTVSLGGVSFNALCGDADGCALTVGVRNYLQNGPYRAHAVGPHQFFLEPSGRWVLASVATELTTARSAFNGDTSRQYVLSTWPEADCAIVDSEPGTGEVLDTGDEFSLFHNPHASFSQNLTCFAIVED